MGWARCALIRKAIGSRACPAVDVAELQRPPDPTLGVAAVRVGDTIADKYLIDSVLGAGGMGIVYLARHLQLDGRVALKFLSAECLGSSEAIERFRREAQAAAKLSSEHVVRVFDVGTHTNGLPYMVMEYLEGRDLGRLLTESGPLSIELAASLLIQTCSAVEDAHRHGIIHRDLKPSNLFCVPHSDGSLGIKVVDFGISKVTGDAAGVNGGITVTGNVIGSPSYMSPEQMKTPNRIDHRTDIWSLGVVLYECLTGKLPFPGSSYAEICLRVHQEPPLDANAQGVELPAALEAIIDRCLAKAPEQRYGTARELAAALLDFAPHSPRSRVPSMHTRDGRSSDAGRFEAARASSKLGGSTGTQPGWVQVTAATRARRRLWLVLSASALVAVGAGGWLLFRSNRAGTTVSAISASAAPRAAAQLAPAAELPLYQAPSLHPVASGTPVQGAAAVPEQLPAPTPSSNKAAPLSRAAPAAGAAHRMQTSRPKPAVKTPARPATERDPTNSIWTR